MAYIRGLKDTGRDREIPRWLIDSDFARITAPLVAAAKPARKGRKLQTES